MREADDKVGMLGDSFGVEGRIGFEQGHGGLVEAWLRSGEASARVSLLGATVLSFRTEPSRELLYLSSRSRFEPGALIRGGIPLCLPWFGAHPTVRRLPRHGFFRLLEWEVAGAKVEGTSSEVLLSLASSEASRLYWPGDFHALCRIVLDGGLRVELEVGNTGTLPWEMGCAFHPYFRFEDIRQVALPGLEGINYEELAGTDSGSAIRRGTGAPSFSEEVDRAYAWPGAVSVEEPGRGPAFEVDSRGVDSLVVWTPWKENCLAMADVDPADYDRFLCVEPALMRPRQVLPGGSFGAALSIAPFSSPRSA